MILSEKLFWEFNLKYYDLQKSIFDLKSVGVEITGQCNLQCRHCYMESSLKPSVEELNLDEWKHFFGELRKDFGKNISIQITGGEPFVRSDIFEILAHLRGLGFVVTVASNGTLLNEEKIRKLKEYVVALSISLDGFEESHNYLRGGDVFEVTMKNIKCAQEEGIPNLGIKTTIYRNNFSELRSFYAFLQDMGIDAWHLFAMEPRGRGNLNKDEVITRAEYEELCEFVDEIRGEKKNKMKITFEEQPGSFIGKKALECNKYKLCHAGISSCAILPNGDVVNCIQGNRESVYGNVRKDNFKEIWHNGFNVNRSKEYRSCRKHHFS